MANGGRASQFFGRSAPRPKPPRRKIGLGPPLVLKIYEPSYHGDMAFLLAVQQGVRAHHWKFGTMPPQPQLIQGEVKTIIIYARELQRANGIK